MPGRRSTPLHSVLVRSAHLQVVEDGCWAVVWHSLFGNPLVVSAPAIELLEAFRSPRTLRSFAEEYTLDAALREQIEKLVSMWHLVPVGVDERRVLAEAVSQHEATITTGALIDYLGIVVSEACNFRCTYCMHFSNLGTSPRTPGRLMTFPVAKRAVDFFLSILRHHRKTIAEINFGGGEPLLGWPVILQVLEYCQRMWADKFQFRFSINTNASLINDEIAAALSRFRVQIASSLDGLKEGNDRVRLTRNGEGTFDDIVAGFDRLAAQGLPLDGIAITVDERNLPFVDDRIISWAATRNMHEIRLDVDAVNTVNVSSEELVQRLGTFRHAAKAKGVEVTGFWARPAENLNSSALAHHVAFCGAARGNSMCVNPGGTIYSCGYSTKALGDIEQTESFFAPDGPYCNFVGSHLVGRLPGCNGCIIEGQCAGGCRITQEFAATTKSAKLDSVCDFYRAMTRELLREQLMEEPRKEVMNGNEES